ncbi:MAG TPA: MFS transporter [Pyrinomonadaceae bacterium]|jgi:MFS family permease
MRSKSKGLRHNRDFIKLWSAHTTSIFGTQTASLAYALTAILVLQATPFEMGVLRAVGSAAAVLVGFFTGVVVDRVARKPLLVSADLGRALLAALIPLFAFLGVLRIEHLYVISFFTGALNITSEVAAMAFLPSIVEKENLVEGNSKLAATESLAVIAGPSLSGLLVQLLSAPVTILVDAVSFVFSAVFVWTIRAPERKFLPEKERRSVWSEIAEGFSFVYKNAILRPLAEAIALNFLFMLMISTIFTLYAIRELNLSPFALGFVFSAFGFGFLLGALVVKRLTNRLGQGKTMVFATLLNAFACLLIPAASGAATLFVLFAAHFLLGLGAQLNGINLMSLRQSMTPNHLQGRMNGSFRFVNVLMMMFGALFAGFLGEIIGLRTVLFIGAIGMFAPFLRLFFSPVRNFTAPAPENF